MAAARSGIAPPAWGSTSAVSSCSSAQVSTVAVTFNEIATTTYGEVRTPKWLSVSAKGMNSDPAGETERLHRRIHLAARELEHVLGGRAVGICLHVLEQLVVRDDQSSGVHDVHIQGTLASRRALQKKSVNSSSTREQFIRKESNGAIVWESDPNRSAVTRRVD